MDQESLRTHTEILHNPHTHPHAHTYTLDLHSLHTFRLHELGTNMSSYSRCRCWFCIKPEAVSSLTSWLIFCSVLFSLSLGPDSSVSFENIIDAIQFQNTFFFSTAVTLLLFNIKVHTLYVFSFSPLVYLSLGPRSTVHRNKFSSASKNLLNKHKYKMMVYQKNLKYKIHQTWTSDQNVLF